MPLGGCPQRRIIDSGVQLSVREIVLAIAVGISLFSAGTLQGSSGDALAMQEIRGATRGKAASSGRCDREFEKLIGDKPIRIGRSQRALKKLRDVRPNYPELPAGTVVTSSVWTGEVLITASGKIAHVWTVREIKLTPPFPGFNDAITNAIRQWEFKPLMVDGEPVPLCMMVSVNIHWQ